MRPRRLITNDIATHRAGAVVPMFAVALPVLLILAAFVINIAYLELLKTEMFIASDAASRAGAKQLALTGDTNIAKTFAQTAASLNRVGGRPLVIADTDIVFGSATRSAIDQRYSFVSGGLYPNAIGITSRFSSTSANGSVPLLIPLPFQNANISADQTAFANPVEVDISLVLDRSGSMAYASNVAAVLPPPYGFNFGNHVPANSRWQDAVSAINVFLEEIGKTPLQERVSLTTYNDYANVDCNLTTNTIDIKNAMQVYTNAFNSGNTNVGAGILRGITPLKTNARPYAARIMIVLTDGLDASPSIAVDAAARAVREQIMVFTVTFSQEADQALMERVAKEGSGKHYHAENGVNLANVFRDISRQLPVIISR